MRAVVYHGPKKVSVDDVIEVGTSVDRVKVGDMVCLPFNIATPIDDSKGDAVQQILDATRGEGADRGVEAISYQAHDRQGNEKPGLTIKGAAAPIASN